MKSCLYQAVTLVFVMLFFIKTLNCLPHTYSTSNLQNRLFYQALIHNDYNSVQQFLKNGVSPNLLLNFDHNRRPLNIVLDNGYYTLAQMLLEEYNANPALTNRLNINSLDIVTSQLAIAKRLQEQYYTPNTKNSNTNLRSQGKTKENLRKYSFYRNITRQLTHLKNIIEEKLIENGSIDQSILYSRKSN